MFIKFKIVLLFAAVGYEVDFTVIGIEADKNLPFIETFEIVDRFSLSLIFRQSKIIVGRESSISNDEFVFFIRALLTSCFPASLLLSQSCLSASAHLFRA